MNPTKLARISVLSLVLFLFLSALPALAAPRCGCDFCQRHPEKNCRLDGSVVNCLEFLAVALCPAASSATSADAPKSKDAFFASLSGQPTQQPTGCLSPAS